MGATFLSGPSSAPWTAAIVSLVVLVDELLPELHASRIVGIEVSIAPAKAVRLTNSRRVIGSIGNLLSGGTSSFQERARHEPSRQKFCEALRFGAFQNNMPSPRRRQERFSSPSPFRGNWILPIYGELAPPHLWGGGAKRRRGCAGRASAFP